MNAAALIAHKTGGVAVIVMHHRAVGISQITNRIELSDGAIHGENAVGRDQDPPGASLTRFLQFGFKVRHVVVAITIA